jgi:hypothetical protein
VTRILKIYPNVSLHGLNNASLAAVELSQFLVHEMGFTIDQIYTQTLVKNARSNRPRKYKIIINVSKTSY